MAEYINVEELVNAFIHNEIDNKGQTVGEVIDSLPIIDIVRCSECIHAKLNWADGEYYCEILQYDFAKDYYCADGRRSDD